MTKSKLYFVLLGFLYFSFSCTHSPVAREPDAVRVYRANDPKLKRGELTIWKLQQVAQSGDFESLNKLFNNGVSLDSLPVGYAAGAAARVMTANGGFAIKFFDIFTESSWRGKIFFQSKDLRRSHGLNRIRRILTVESAPFVPMASFTTELLDRHPLTPEATSRLVTLNYASPVSKSYLPELLLTQIQVYDLMVAVPGKYGPVYIGKTWLGKYNEHGQFIANNPNELLAWFFLDFNQAALDDQMKNHVDASDESPINYSDI